MFFCDAILDFYISQELWAQIVKEVQLMNSQSEIFLEFIVRSSTQPRFDKRNKFNFVNKFSPIFSCPQTAL